MHEKHIKELQESIKSLKKEKDSLDETQIEKKEKIGQFIKDLEHHIMHPEDSEHATHLREDMPGLIKLLEIEHPGITNILNRISIILSNMGI